jgi:predicted transcriptional regulator
MNVAPGTILWVYVKLPIGSIVGYATIEKVHSSSPETLWRKYASISGLSRREFFDYFGDVEQGVALVLKGSTLLRSSLPLKVLRQLDNAFQPPQFCARLTTHHPLPGAVTASG